MKEIKPIHLVIAVIFVLLAVAVLQWKKLPQSTPPMAPQTSAEPRQTAELPVLPQNELYNSEAIPSFLKEPPPFEESSGENNLEPKDKARTGKAML